ncbi:MAG: aspartate carbamoyltransferase catalytic subunit [Candidatus Sumerlaeia bacterium]|nr:aspartate carbamoyltransferase catalytic subunit [Candidatus Sumerlaeia bacterium]
MAVEPAHPVAQFEPVGEFTRRHLLDIESLTRAEIERVLHDTAAFKDVLTRSVKKLPTLQGRSVVNIFFESSTRTRTSFEVAAKRLSADVTNFTVATSAVAKGESLLDTAKTIRALGADYIVLRHASAGVPHLLAREMPDVSIINAGDGCHEHPTQALLDLYTMLEKLGRIEELTVAIVGDILHSRVARSNIWALTKLGAKVRVVGPRTLIPRLAASWGVEVHHDLTEGIRDADVVYLLRIQMERMTANLFPSIREYKFLYAITEHRLRHAKPHAIVMHPGPTNRGVEIDGAVADGPRSVIDAQVTNGIAARMAVFYLLSGARKEIGP